ncbi:MULTISPECIES: outer membrane lipoprotein carrier protein LolA [Oleiagrimonas]|jgi:hypothetical protein|nr:MULTISPECIES: outer membrane lipoprotein carrier protein LolA [Oleiagrimonas]
MMLALASAATWARAPETAVVDKPDALAPIAKLAQQPPTQVAFAEARFSALLSRPLVVSGQLSWEGGDRLQRHVDSPYVETTRIVDGEVSMHRAGRGTRHFSLDRAPPLKALLDSLVAVLSGDRARLSKVFTPRLDEDGGGQGWTLTLKPKSPRLARSLAHIRLDGDDRGLRCMLITEANGTLSVDLLGPLAARMPTQPTRANLTALCRHAE